MRIIVTGGNSGIGKATAGALADSKLAIMLFVDELARRGVRAYVADPGGTDTDIIRDSTGLFRWTAEHHRLLAFLAQDPPVAARSSIQAVTTDLPSGTYIAPRFKHLGKPKVRKHSRRPAIRSWLVGCGNSRPS